MDYRKMIGANGATLNDGALGLLEGADVAERYAKAVRMALLGGYSPDFIVERVIGYTRAVERDLFAVMREAAVRLEAGLQNKFTGY